jgi:two-component system nitrate/nitrite sensor histidine kinase NarX
MKNIRLQVQDNGRGFDPAEVSSEHLGLGIMRERADAIGADLILDTEIGRGTEVVVEWCADGA